MNEINLCEVSNWFEYAAFVLALLLEAWLGKTNKTKSGSIIELILNISIRIIKATRKLLNKPKG